MDLRKTPLLTDLYQLNMLQTYLESGETKTAVFEFLVRRLPQERGFLRAASLEQVLDFVQVRRSSSNELEWLTDSGRFGTDSMRYAEHCLRYAVAMARILPGAFRQGSCTLTQINAFRNILCLICVPSCGGQRGEVRQRSIPLGCGFAQAKYRFCL